MLALGNIYKECIVCHGVGFVAPAPAPLVHSADIVKIDKRSRAYKEKVRS